MKPIKGRHKAPEDYISQMPHNVLTHILDRLSLQEAVRTSILSRNWRFKWTTLSQLLFSEQFFNYVTRGKSYENYERIIGKLLLHFEGDITKFDLHLDKACECYDIAPWILFLSRKRVKELTICMLNGPLLKLPTHLYSCLELKHLVLDTCWCDPPASFHGFPNLLSLELCYAQCESEKLFEFLTQCPVLEILYMGVCDCANLEPVQFAKLRNLKVLSLSLCNLDNTMITSSSSIFELVGFLPKLQELELDFEDCKPFIEDDARWWASTTFPCLKTLEVSNLDLSSGIMLSFAFQMIKSSPSLQTLKITSGDMDVDQPPTVCYPEVDYNTLGLLQLQSVEFRVLKALDNEIWLIKHLLACSPLLKKMAIYASSLPSDEKLKFATRLLELHRASLVSKINLY